MVNVKEIAKQIRIVLRTSNVKIREVDQNTLVIKLLFLRSFTDFDLKECFSSIECNKPPISNINSRDVNEVQEDVL